ncbi:MAG: flagellar biosynthetic protein FliR [Tissierellia bacterium]|nr:flagellar biosynthetic protein FliR [Tissierellia bacterium]MDD4781461.1 flagellar biosynthetic protein FliR [Tissierellia bacterium]
MTFLGDFTYFLLILARMSGCVFFNQVFGRGSLPVLLKTLMTLFLAIIIYGILPPEANLGVYSIIEYIVLIIKEIFIGYLISYIMNLFFSTIVVSGEIIGMQIGMSMSQIYDPSSNISMGLIGSFLNIILILIFFIGNGHINLIKIFITSCKLINIGNFIIHKDLFYNMVEIFQQILILSLKLSMPIIAIEIMLEAGIGILMKAIPQIQVFSVNIQLKIVVGLLALLILVPTFSTFIDNTITLMFEQIEKSLTSLSL